MDKGHKSLEVTAVDGAGAEVTLPVGGHGAPEFFRPITVTGLPVPTSFVSNEAVAEAGSQLASSPLSTPVAVQEERVATVVPL